MRASTMLVIVTTLAAAGGVAVAQDLPPVPPHDLTWVQTAGAALEETVTGVVVDASGDVLSAGHFSGTVTFGFPPNAITLTAQGGRNLFVTRQDARGNLRWAKQMGGSGSTNISTNRSLAAGPDGSLYLTGWFSGTTDFDPGAGTSPLTALGTNDGFLIHLSRDGDLLEANQFGGPGASGYPLAVAASGFYVYVVGYCEGRVDLDPGGGVSLVGSTFYPEAFAVKLYGGGALAWARQGDSQAAFQAVAIDGAENVWVGGTNGLLRRYTSAGFNDWYDYFSGGIVDLAVDEAGAVYAGGYAFAAPYTGRVLKVDGNGTLLWSKSLGGPGESLVTSLVLGAGPGGKMDIVGRFSGTANLSFSNVPEARLTSAGQSDAFVTRFSRTGLFYWTQRMGGTGADEAHAVAADATGNLFVAGIFRDTADFDGGPGTANRISAGGADGFVARLGDQEILLDGASPTLIHFQAAAVSPTFDVVTGLLSELAASRTFGSAACLGRFTSSPAIDSSTPPLGDGFYYLARAVTCCGEQAYGSSGLDPDPRADLALADPCP